MGWLDRLLTPKKVQDIADQQKQAHEQLKHNIKEYLDLPGVEEAERLLQGKTPDGSSIVRP